MPASPTARTLKLLRDAGYTADVTERWLPSRRLPDGRPDPDARPTRRDLFECIDVVAIRADWPGVLGVQCTSASNQAARLRKIAELPAARTWLLAGNRLQVWGWRKLKTGRWDVNRRDVRIEDLEPVRTA